MHPNTFDEVLGLEETFYNGGFRQGWDDGIIAGKIEGRTFGLEKGFEKYVESGKLYGKTLVWANRTPRIHHSVMIRNPQYSRPVSDSNPERHHDPTTWPTVLPSLSHNQRLSNHLKVLSALSESDSLSTENTEESVSNFDDRLKRAQGKAKIIERLIGESGGELLDGIVMEKNLP